MKLIWSFFYFRITILFFNVFCFLNLYLVWWQVCQDICRSLTVVHAFMYVFYVYIKLIEKINGWWKDSGDGKQTVGSKSYCLS